MSAEECRHIEIVRVDFANIFLYLMDDVDLLPHNCFAGQQTRALPVRIVAYTLATAISFSRVTTGAHFPSDVFIGAATGFTFACFDVLRR